MDIIPPYLGSGGGGGVQNNYAGTAAPTSAADSAAGYAAGSQWLWVATGQVWVCRDATASAAKWEMVGLSAHPGYISGNWYPMWRGATYVAGSAPGANTIRLVPFNFESRINLNSLGVRIATVSAGGNVQLAVYAHNSATGRPTGNALGYTGSMSTASLTAVSAALAGGNALIELGTCWMAVNSDNGTSTCKASSTSMPFTSWWIGSPTLSDISSGSTTGSMALSVTGQTFGTWPDLTSATFVVNTATTTFALADYKAA